MDQACFQHGNVFPCNFDGMRERGHAIPVGDWWLRLARRVITDDSRTRKYEDLGVALAKHVRRKTPFKRALISKFVTGQAPATLELAKAICIEFRIPPPFAIARSYAEAAQLMSVTERYDDQPELGEDAPIYQIPTGAAKKKPGAMAAEGPAAHAKPRRSRIG